MHQNHTPAEQLACIGILMKTVQTDSKKIWLHVTRRQNYAYWVSQLLSHTNKATKHKLTEVIYKQYVYQ